MFGLPRHTSVTATRPGMIKRSDRHSKEECAVGLVCVCVYIYVPIYVCVCMYVCTYVRAYMYLPDVNGRRACMAVLFNFPAKQPLALAAKLIRRHTSKALTCLNNSDSLSMLCASFVVLLLVTYSCVLCIHMHIACLRLQTQRCCCG